MIRQKKGYSLKAINILVIIAMMLGGVVLNFGPVEATAGDIVIIAPAEDALIPVKNGDSLTVQFTVDSTGKAGAGDYQILIGDVVAGTYSVLFDGSAAQPFTRTITIPIMLPANEGIQGLSVELKLPGETAFGHLKIQQNAVIVDNLLPVAPVLTLPNGGETIPFGGTYNITWTAYAKHADETFSLYLSADNGTSWSKIADILDPQSTTSYTWTPSVLTTQGLIKIEVVDKAGNKAADQSAEVFTIYGVDHDAPTVSMVALPAFIKGTYTLEANATDTQSGITGVLFQYSLDEGENWLDVGAGSYDGTSWELDFNTATRPDGAVQFRAIATNGIGLSTTSAPVDAVIDNSVPEILSFNLTDGDWLKEGYEFVVEASDAQSGITKLEITQLVGTSWSAVCSDTDPGTDVGGVYTLRCTDPTSGGLDAAATKIKAVVTNGINLTYTVERAVQVDLVAPVVTNALVTPADDKVLHLGDPLTIEWEPDEIEELHLAGIDLELRGASNITIASGEANDGSYAWTVSGLQSDGYEVCLVARDLAGNTAEDCNTGITIWGADTTAPTVTLAPIASPNTGTIALSATAADPQSGIQKVEFYYKEVGDEDYTLIELDTVAPYELSWDSTGKDGEFLFKAVATNGGGFTSEHEIGPVLIDNTTPTIGDLSKAGNIYKVSASDAGSGIASVVFEYDDDGSWVEIGEGVLNPVSGKYESPAWQNVGDFDVHAVATDKVGLQVTSVAYTPDCSIDLVTGWNLISLPLIPDAPDIDDVLADLVARGSVKQVVGWVHEGGALTPKVWDGEHLFEIDNLDPEFGYWVEMDAEDAVVFDGSIMPAPPQAPPSYVVYAGWNLIGFKSTIEMAAKDYLGEAGEDNMRSMYRYDDGVYEQVIGTTLLTPGYGYWLAVSVDATIYPPAALAD